MLFIYNSLIFFIVIGSIFFLDRVFGPISTAPAILKFKPTKFSDCFWVIINILAILSVIIISPIVVEFCDFTVRKEYLEFDSIIKLGYCFIFTFPFIFYALLRINELHQIMARLSSPGFYDEDFSDSGLCNDDSSNLISLTP